MIFKILSFVQQSAADSLAAIKIAENSKKFQEVDPWGIGMTFVGLAVVFLSLLMLYVLFFNITRLLNLRLKKSSVPKTEAVKSVKEPEELTGEVNAAIAIAIHLYMNELHDKESAVLTINKVARTYSPWSSKIYGLRQNPR